ncbi:MAG TPA: RES family NAD+ phosphorylase [Rhizomicrobium sp.]
MKLAAVSLLPLLAETRTWYRAVDVRFLPSAIATGHTRVIPSRFYDPHSASPQFPTLYLSDSQVVAMFEAQALFGSPTTPGGSVPAPRGAWAILSVSVRLQRIADLSVVASQALLDTSVQELTGDWVGYRQRSSLTNVAAPTGTAPTQALGEALHRDPRLIEGFIAVSAKVPYNQNLIVFPAHLGAGSSVDYAWQDASGSHTYRVDQNNPGGYYP